MTDYTPVIDDARADSYADANFRERITIIHRAFLSYLGIIAYLLIPTLKLKTFYVLALARLPLFKKFEFFRSMFKLIEEESKKGAKS